MFAHWTRARTEYAEALDTGYERGLSTQLEVLDAQRQLFSAELELTSTMRDQLAAVAQLYNALGGGWQGQPPAEGSK